MTRWTLVRSFGTARRTWEVVRAGEITAGRRNSGASEVVA